ncbi:MAG: serine hydrolase [Candidatus Delongbacteria bacterium]|nr:serine hydrolase [Candidatus Delongbacteria bacterium]
MKLKLKAIMTDIRYLNLKNVFFTIYFLFFVHTGFAQSNEKNFYEFDQKNESLMQDYNAVGLSVAVIQNNEVIYSKGFGYRDLEKKLPVTTNTVLPIGSVTKAFTGALLGILEEENKVDLKARPSDYIPEFEFYNDEMNKRIIIEDLLCHKSGIGNTGTADVFFPTENKLDAVKRLKYLKPEAALQNSFAYSNMGYTLAGTIAEQVTKKTWNDNIKEQIFEPLGMQNSYTTLSEMEQTADYSLPYGIYNGDIEEVQYEKFHSLSPAGAIKSNVIDMSKWMMTWLNNGRFEEKQIIPTDYVERATQLQNISHDAYEKDAFLFGEGFGWRLRSSYGNFRIEHGGNTYGFSSDLAIFPLDNVGIVVLTNQDNSQLPFMVVDLIARSLFDKQPYGDYPVVVKEVYHPNTNDKPLNQEKLPSHPLKDYCGKFEADGIGTIEITLEGTKLFAQFPTFLFQLEHLNFNAFHLEGTSEFSEVFNPEFTLEFFNDLEGNVSHLKLYSQKEPIDFVKLEIE